jgi:tetratricopeptide (TPR) repeat protein
LGTPAATLLIAEGLAINVDAFAQEAVRIRTRLGLKLVPTLIELRGHRNPDIRRWASRGLKLLGVSDAAVATQQGGPEELAATLHAYGSTHDLEALPVMVSFLNDTHIQVRTAARESVRALGRNAIWKLRIAYQEVTGTNANPGWNSEQTLTELCLLFDRERIERGETALARGLNAHLAGDLLLMSELFEQALRVDPQLPRRAEMAPGFAALGSARAAHDDLDGAQSAYRRALRLAPNAAEAATWRAELSYLRAEHSLSRGVVDMDGYLGALALAADHAKAADAIDRLSGAWSERAERSRRLIAVLAIVLLSGCGLAVLRARRPISGSQATERVTAGAT